MLGRSRGETRRASTNILSVISDRLSVAGDRKGSFTESSRKGSFSDLFGRGSFSEHVGMGSFIASDRKGSFSSDVDVDINFRCTNNMSV